MYGGKPMRIKVIILSMMVLSACDFLGKNKKPNLETYTVKDAVCVVDRPPLLDNSNIRVIVAMFFESGSKQDCLDLTERSNKRYSHNNTLYSCTCRNDAI